MKRERPLLIYDGDCRFCMLWIARWRAITGDKIEYRSSREAVAEFPELAPEIFERSVQFLDTDGRRYERASAVFRSLATATLAGRVLLRAHEAVPGFGAVCDGLYGVVARNRTLFSLATRWLWGSDASALLPPSYGVSTTIFLRLLGLIYAIAFISFGSQAAGLIGEHGILPVGEIFPAAGRQLGGDAWWQWPSLLWLSPTDAMVSALTWAGLGCAVLIVAGVAQPLALLGAWAAYLSLVVAGQEFYSFQWDILLLEAGLLAIFAAPWRWRPNLAIHRPSRLAHFLFAWLLFRLMFSSGVEKLSSGDPTWSHFTALEFHYWTQPLPNVIAWWANQAPAWFQKVSCLGMFGVELVLPFFIFLPRRLRLIAFAGIVGLQGLIALTGNYGFFNLLTVALAILLVDDAAWLGRRDKSYPQVGWSRWVLPLPAVAYVALSLVPLAGAFRSIPPAVLPLARVYEYAAPFRSINGYGLFATMTTTRPEIVFQGSMDGVNWQTYEFKYKPGPLNRPPPFVAPYMPRLDWQMWFASMQDVRATPWMGQFVLRLFEARPEVLALLSRDPFDGRPPRYVRAMLEEYRFTDFQEGRTTGNWWHREQRGIYFPQISQEDLER